MTTEFICPNCGLVNIYDMIRSSDGVSDWCQCGESAGYWVPADRLQVSGRPIAYETGYHDADGHDEWRPVESLPEDARRTVEAAIAASPVGGEVAADGIRYRW